MITWHKETGERALGPSSELHDSPNHWSSNLLDRFSILFYALKIK